MARLKDPLSNSHQLAILAAFNGFFVYPVLVMWLGHRWAMSDARVNHFLTYMGVMALPTVLGYLYSAHRRTMQKESRHAIPDKVLAGARCACVCSRRPDVLPPHDGGEHGEPASRDDAGKDREGGKEQL